MNSDEYRKYVLLPLLQAYFDGDALAKVIFESADFRQAVRSMNADLSAGLNVAQESRDPLEPGPDSPVFHMLVRGFEPARDLMKDIRLWLRGATRVTICDPYLLCGASGGIHHSDDAYIESIASLLPSTATSVNVYGHKFKAKVRSGLKRRLKNGRSLRIYYSNEIHDRYIIKDGTEGKMFGASFGGFGTKIFTALDLPAEDTRRLVEFLSTITNETPIA